MTLSEMEKRQEELHEQFEKAKSACYEKYTEMLKLSEEYNRIEDEIKKLKGNV